MQGTEIARAIGQFTEGFVSRYNPSAFQLKTLDALAKCRTQALGGHWYECDCCHKRKKSYNSCRNRHCPKRQSARQAFWVEDRINQAYAVKHFHLVFTLPNQLNEICLLDNRWFYSRLCQPEHPYTGLQPLWCRIYKALCYTHTALSLCTHTLFWYLSC
jgi:hypothetical protein